LNTTRNEDLFVVLFSLVGFFSDVFGCYGIFSRLGWLLIGCSVSSYALGFTNNGLLWRDRFHNQYDNRHWCLVAGSVTDLCDTGIPAFTVCHGWANNSEQFVHNRFVGACVTCNKALNFTTSGEVTLFCEGDKALSVWLETFGLSQRGLDGLVLKQA